MKIKIFLSSCLLSLFCFNSFGQIEFSTLHFGSDKDDRAINSAQDKELNTYTVGYFSDTMDLVSISGNIRLISAGGGDAFLLKHNKDNQLVWAKSMGSLAYDFFYDVVVSTSGDILVCGGFAYTVSAKIDGNTEYYTSKGYSDIIVAKFNPDGEALWVRTFGGTEDDECTAIKLTKEGDVVVVGSFEETMVYDEVSGASLKARGTDLVVIKLSGNGTPIWAKNYLTRGDVYHPNAELDEGENILVTGDFSGEMTFYHNGDSTKIKEVDGPDNFLIKLDSLGQFTWGLNNSGRSWDMGRAIATDADLNIYHTGFFSDSANFGILTGQKWIRSKGGFDCFLRKLDKNGKEIWLKTFGGNGDDNASGLALRGNSLYVSGCFQSRPIDFDPGLDTCLFYSAGAENGFIQRYDTSGTMVWTSTFKSKGYDAGMRVKAFKKGYVAVTGYYNDSCQVKFGEDSLLLRSNGGKDGLVILFKDCQSSYDTVSLSGCDAVDFSEHTYTESGEYQLELTNYAGCDSTVTLNITLNKSDVIYLNHSTCEPYTLNGVVYDTSGTYYQNYINQANCDSILVLKLDYPRINDSIIKHWGTFSTLPNQGSYQWIDCNDPGKVLTNANYYIYSPVSDGSYAVIISSGSCTDTSECLAMINAGIEKGNRMDTLSIYPNPATKELTIHHNENASSGVIELFDALGRLIASYTVHNQKITELGIQTLPPGNYSGRLVSKGDLSWFRFIVVRQ